MKSPSHWLLKTEPSCWSFEDQLRDKITAWDGVRNYQAQNYLKQIKIDEECFFYHSHICQIVGIVKIIKAFYLEENETRFGQVDVVFVRALRRPISLKEIKAFSHLLHLPLIKQSRLSVMPIDQESWEFILERENIEIIKNS